jgi:hypothetical protein
MLPEYGEAKQACAADQAPAGATVKPRGRVEELLLL